MQFEAKCTASVAKNGSAVVLLRFAPRAGHLMGDIPKGLGELKAGKTYRITIEEVE